MEKCVIIFSGGLDSTTILALAKSQGYEIYALTFNYEQRHKIEIEHAKKIAELYGVNHKIFDINLSSFGGSALTDLNIDVPSYKDMNEIPDKVTSTYVPARNIIFLSLALAYAETIGANDIFYGANKMDLHNYPDCTIPFLESFRIMANIGTKTGSQGASINILAPLIDMHKDQIIKLGLTLGVDYSLTMSCYNPDHKGKPCGKCMSCQVRQDNFRKVGIADPAL